MTARRAGPQRPATTRRRALACLLGFALGAAGCGEGPPAVVILTPANGAFVAGGELTVAGLLVGVDLESVSDVRVNGVSVLPLGGANDFSTSVSLEPGVLIQPIVAEVIGESGGHLSHRITVIQGGSVADGDFSLNGIALRLTDLGLQALEPLVQSLVTIDLAALVPPGSLVVDNFCYQDSIFGCLGRVDATVSGSPPPSISGFTLDMDPMSGFVTGDITLSNLFFRANVVAVTGIPFSCTVDVTAATTTVLGDYGLEPLASDPNEIDVEQLGGVTVAFGSFNDSTNCGGFLGFIVEFFLDLFVSDLQNDLVRPGIESFLETPDAQGNTPIAAAIESALEAIEIAGPIGEALGVSLEAPLFAALEDPDGLTLGSDARILASLPDPQAVDLTASYHVDQAFPTFGPTSPGGLPYDMAICISASAFNQLLKAEIESGLLITVIDELDLGGGPVPLTAGLLAAILPPFALLDPAEPLQFVLRPGAAPIVSGEPGPLGELAALFVPHLEISLVPAADPEVVLLGGVIDASLGMDASFAAGEIAFVVTPPTAQDIGVTLSHNPLFVSEATLGVLLPSLVTGAIPLLADSLGSFPLPAFLGLSLDLVEVDRTGEYTSLYFDLLPAP